jgi:hypothetical protein
MRKSLTIFVTALSMCAAIAHFTRSAAAVSSNVVISQVYGGGGNAGATIKNDFIELYNRGAAPVRLTGWSVQYASANGTSWQVTPIGGVLQPGQYYLVQEAVGAGGTVALSPNAVGTIPMAAGAGKVALVNTTVALAGTGGNAGLNGTTCPSGNGAIVDFIGYGTGGSGATCSESATQAPTLTNTTADLRNAANQNPDTDQNGADFASGTPNPRNSTVGPWGTGSATPASVPVTTSTTLSMTTNAGTNPASPVTSVVADLTSIGGSSAQAFTANGAVYSFTATIPANVTPGAKTITATITDQAGDSDTATISLTVPTPTALSGTGTATPSTVAAGASTALSVTVTPGTNPASTGITVLGDLTAIGGLAAQAFTNAANVFSFTATVPAGTSAGPKVIPIAISDAQGRTAGTSITVTVSAAPTNPVGTGNATGPVHPGDQTLITVAVTPGANPTSAGLAVVADLSTIGGSAAQTLFDDGTNGDQTAGDNIFSIRTAVPSTQAVGVYSLPFTVSDNFPRSSNGSISLTVLAATTVKISQVYGGGGNSGSTYTNDFIELFNAGTAPVVLDGWSVQETSANQTNWSANGAPTPLSGTLQPGHYYLVKESQGAGGTANLPAADATGVITMGAGSGKVALVSNTTPLTGQCTVGGAVVDMVGYGGSAALCFETAPTAGQGNTVGALRLGNGCIDTDNNLADFVALGPTPRNSASPVQLCGADPTVPFGVGTANPNSLEPAAETLLTVAVTPAQTGSSNIGVVADLTNIGGSSTQTFYDDGTHGDLVAGDRVFSFTATVNPFASLGAKSMPVTITSAEAAPQPASITLTAVSPTCGVERWSVKVGTDNDVGQVNLANSVWTTLQDLRNIPAPATPPDNARVGPTELTLYRVNGTMTLYKKETDVDYHIVLTDDSGNTIVTEIPSPACILKDGSPRTLVNGPFSNGIASARAQFDARFSATPNFQAISVPVQLTGVAFFDFLHGQTGVAPNGIEIHPILNVAFTSNSTTTLLASANPSVFGDTVTFTATVSNGTATLPTGQVTFYDGANVLGVGAVDQNGNASFTTSGLSVGAHSVTAHYDGDGTSATSTSAPVNEVVGKANQVITVGALPAQQPYGAADLTVTANASSGLLVNLSVTGPATLNGNSLHVTGVGDVVVQATQAGDGNYNAAPEVDRTIHVVKADQVITFGALGTKTYGDAPFTVAATGGASGQIVTFAASGTCTSTGGDGSTISIGGAGSCSVTASQAGTGNYNAAPDVARTFAINQAQATITTTAFSGVYDAQPHGITFSIVTPTGEDVSSLFNAGATFTDVPGGTAHWTFAGNANFVPAAGDTAVTITAKAVTTVADSATRMYGVANPSFTGTSNGLVASDNVAVSFTSTATPASGVGTYPITASFADPGHRLTNYMVSSTDGTLTVTDAGITITVANATRGYGAANPAFSGTILGVVDGDGISASYATTATAASPIGTYPITATPVDPNGKLSDYDVAITPGTLTVTAVSLSVQAADASRVYGTANPAFTGTLQGLVNNDGITASYNSAATPQSSVGTYPIVPALNDPNQRLGNYVVSSGNGQLTVTQATLVAAANNATVEYGAANATFTGGLTGAVTGDGLSVSFVSTVSSTSPLGAYPNAIVPQVSDPNSRLGNYSVQLQRGTLTIVDTTPPSLTVPASFGVQALNPAGTTVTYTVSASDTAPGAVTVSCLPASGSVFVVGATTVYCTARDASGNTTQKSFVVTVAGDTTPPTIQSVTPSTGVLWPPNKKMVPVSIRVAVTDNVDPAPFCRVTTISANEGTSADWQITGPLTVSLRATRLDDDRTRVYTISVTCTDAFHNSSIGSTRVVVLGDQEDDDDQGDNNQGNGKKKGDGN